MSNGYGFRVEVKGEYACFSRPELKVERVSYDVITPSAARGIMEAVLWKPAISYVIDQIDICAPIRFENIRRNEVNKKITQTSIATAETSLLNRTLHLDTSNDRSQRAALVLRDVCYVISGHFVLTDRAGSEDNEAKFSSMLRRRLEKGQCYHTPYLGTREFPAKVSLLNPGDEAPKPISETRSFGIMLYDIEYQNSYELDGSLAVEAFVPMFFSATMVNGVINLRGVEVLR